MLALRSSLNNAAPILVSLASTTNQCRGMATLKDIRVRLKSVTNIRKITQSMKMVSAAKYARAERDLKNARVFGSGALQFYEQSDLVTEEDKEKTKPGTLIVAITSDRGLCGAVHSSVAKKVRHIMAHESDADKIQIVCVGDKAKLMLARQFANNILMMFNDFGKKPPQFGDAREVASQILNSNFEFDRGIIIYNQFKTVVSYNTTEIPVFSRGAINLSPKISVYDSLDEDVIRSYYEYSLASLIFFAMKENACSEQSSRMTAMDSASKNAGEMIQKLTLTFNRTRQAVITKELIEIISGAAAL
ncbi:ATP synthase, gamma subunit [Dermatophagoides pteronyssinus]|uniref:ATP synthase subunit gamma n=2 Tax=Dermatophagoides pteronyssinus TaxID=6956 RepID=A0A6P6Y1M8_DERPT|nr:ATP synthase subunit gamma, mitochondrial-like [Dermatophagoides pteronyssinus]KAH9419621.1 ATP synthase subunit gamma, mitochondrial [Dermatophagoides pteronyssinus]